MSKNDLPETVHAFDFALQLLDWCEKNGCNGKGQRMELVSLIDKYAAQKDAEISRLQQRVKELEGALGAILTITSFYEQPEDVDPIKIRDIASKTLKRIQ